MTQKSLFWEGYVLGDAVYAPYDAEDKANYIYAALNGNKDISGIVPYEGSELSVQDISSALVYKVRVPVGEAFVKGYRYVNDANIDLTVNPSGTAPDTYYRIVLKALLNGNTNCKSSKARAEY